LKWRSHIHILKSVLETTEIKLDERVLRGLFKGIVEPDLRPDYDKHRKRPVKQHDKTVIKLVKYYLQLAIYLYYRGELEESGRALGRAVHYAQDLVLKRRKFLILDVHDNIERRIDELCRNIDIDIVRECISKRPRRSNNPYDVLCSAIAVTYRILNTFVENVNRRKILARVTVALSSASIAAIVMLLGVYAVSSIIVFVPSLAVLAISLIYVVRLLRYTYSKPKSDRFRTVM